MKKHGRMANNIHNDDNNRSNRSRRKNTRTTVGKQGMAARETRGIPSGVITWCTRRICRVGTAELYHVGVHGEARCVGDGLLLSRYSREPVGRYETLSR